MATDVSFKGAAQAPTDPKGPTGELANWLYGLRLEAVPEVTRERAKHLISRRRATAMVRYGG